MHIIWAGLRRSPVRSALTLLSAAVAFVLFGLLQGLMRWPVVKRGMAA